MHMSRDMTIRKRHADSAGALIRLIEIEAEVAGLP